jgi:4-amino-4-deoxy-L-arabinose transferase-like glycosyltransferase
VNRDVKDRLVLPIVIPLAATVALAFVILAFSRILLAVPQEAATPIALAMALNVLTGAALFASLPRLRSWVLKGVLVVGALILAGGAVTSMAVSGELEDLFKGEEKVVAEEHGGEVSPPPPPPTSGPGPGIIAKGIAFNVSELRLPAENATPLPFDNQDAGIPHNVSIYTEQGAESLFSGEIITGPAKVDYPVPPLEAGSYYFQCDVHPNMNGTVTVA